MEVTDVWESCWDNGMNDSELLEIVLQIEKNTISQDIFPKYIRHENKSILQVKIKLGGENVQAWERNVLFFQKVSQEAVASNRPYSFSTTGKWIFYYDGNQIDNAWAKFVTLYDAGKLHGIQQLCRAKEENAKSPGFVILAFAGPTTETTFITEVGKNLVKAVGHKRQRCNGQFPPYVYYKLCQKKPLFKDGPMYYKVQYE
jgi:hypothetical protein